MNIADKTLELACLLASYEMDEPHTDASEYYPLFTQKRFLEWLNSDHAGDCTKMPHPCNRCYADQIAYKANWIQSNEHRIS
jgi:hypothetical protein